MRTRYSASWRYLDRLGVGAATVADCASDSGGRSDIHSRDFERDGAGVIDGSYAILLPREHAEKEALQSRPGSDV